MGPIEDPYQLKRLQATTSSGLGVEVQRRFGHLVWPLTFDDFLGEASMGGNKWTRAVTGFVYKTHYYNYLLDCWWFQTCSPQPGRCSTLTIVMMMMMMIIIIIIIITTH